MFCASRKVLLKVKPKATDLVSQINHLASVSVAALPVRIPSGLVFPEILISIIVLNQAIVVLSAPFSGLNSSKLAISKEILENKK
ncbi:hypothetical protein D770_16405 [Flammeovirgaceae bacterium 311]|nr:hypothetical protein D770_16405 [Flammeovirgaceae bacterium 311]